MRELEAIHARQALLARLGARPMHSTGSVQNVDALFTLPGDQINTEQVFRFGQPEQSDRCGYIFVCDLSPGWESLCYPHSMTLLGTTPASTGTSTSTATVRTRAVPISKTLLAGAITSFAIECLRDNEFLAIIANLDKMVELPHRAQLRARLEELHNVWQEENGPDRAMSVRSLNGLVGFLRRFERIRMPSIVNTPEGTLLAEWRTDERHLFSVHFLSEGEVRFVVFSPDSVRRKVVNRAFGDTTVEHLLDVAQTWGADRWVRE